MINIVAGCAIYRHNPDSPPELYGRVVHTDSQRDLVVISLFPRNASSGHISHYIKKPLFRRLSAVARQIQDKEYSVVQFEIPSCWLYSDEQLFNNNPEDLLRHTRRHTNVWLQHRDEAYELIRPFVEGRSIPEILLDTNFSGWPAKRAKELKLSGAGKVYRSLNAYIQSLGLLNGLLPNYANCGAPGKQKFSTRKTGRPREHNTEGEYDGINCSADARAAFALGWKKFKKPSVSVKDAFQKTLEEFFVQSISWNGDSAKVKLLPEALQYTEEQFEYWGTHHKEALSALQINKGETEHHRQYAARQTRSASKFASVNSDAMLDSTSCDQTLVSSASRLRVLSSPWKTEVMGAYVNYIFGHHVGFESASSTTALMAICHAAESKVDYCERFGFPIRDEEWLSMKFAKFLLDNGEGKSQMVMKTFEELQCGAIYGAAYNAINKATQESSHNKGHKALDHKIPGSTMGKRKRRGEPARALLARFNFEEYLEREIERVHNHNNVQIISPPLIAMRRDCIDGTRRSAVEWLIANGRFSSVSADYDRLKVRCLPAISGFLDSRGVQLYDPLSNGKRIIKELEYTNPWVHQESFKLLRNGKRRRVVVHMNPSDLSQCWCNLEGKLHHLTLRTQDPQLRLMTLLDWLHVCSDDKRAFFRSKIRETVAGIEKNAAIKRITKHADGERKQEIKALARSVTKTELQSDISLNTAIERSARSGIPKLSPKAEAQLAEKTLPSHKDVTSFSTCHSFGEDMDDVMKALKER